jgi:hypothetical protein
VVKRELLWKQEEEFGPVLSGVHLGDPRAGEDSTLPYLDHTTTLTGLCSCSHFREVKAEAQGFTYLRHEVDMWLD